LPRSALLAGRACGSQRRSFHEGVTLQDGDAASGGHFVFVSARAFLGNSKTSVADMNNEAPTPAKAERILPVLEAIAPIAYGPANAPRFPTELIKAIPAAAENPVRNSLGIDQKGP